MKLSHQVRHYSTHALGYSLPEVLLSLLALSVFSLVAIQGMQALLEFKLVANKKSQVDESFEQTYYQLQVTLDSLEEILSQSYFSKSDLFALASNNQCTYSPSQDWNLPGPKISMTAGYKACLMTTTIQEKSIQDNLLFPSLTKPGIYILVLKPEELSLQQPMIRRIICRPRPFCRYI